jgi:hypothetical protein
MARKKKTSEDEPSNENLSTNSDSDDTFGLPDIEYKPLNREEDAPASAVKEEQVNEVVQQETPRFETEHKPMEQNQNNDFTYEPEEDESPAWPKVVGILFIVLVAVGAVWYFMSYKPAQEKARIAEQARLDKEQQDKIAQEERDRLAREAAQRTADSLANASKTGEIITLSERTGRYYVIAASAVDDDLLMDHAKQLSTQGVSIKIIPPFAKYKLFRLAIADSDTFASAQTIADSKKPDFGDAVWVLKY